MGPKTVVPFADPLWLTRGVSAYYKDSHRRLQQEARSYVDAHLAPNCESWEEQGSVPAEVRSVLTFSTSQVYRGS